MYQAHDTRHRHRITHSVARASGRVPHELAQEQELALMLAAFKPDGGVVSGDQLAALLRDHGEQPMSTVARWVVRREILCLGWQGQTLIPLFQFDRVTLQPRAWVAAVIRELTGVYDDWDIGLWFARPNAWLSDETPAQWLRTDPDGVLKAAQADRFAFRG